MKKIPTWFKVVFVIAVIGFVYMIGENYYTEYQYESNRKTIEASIIEMEDYETVIEDYTGGSLFVDTKIDYEFKIEDKNFNGSDVWFAGESHTMSLDKKTIVVEYIDNNPNMNRLTESKGLSVLVK